MDSDSEQARRLSHEEDEIDDHEAQADMDNDEPGRVLLLCPCSPALLSLSCSASAPGLSLYV